MDQAKTRRIIKRDASGRVPFIDELRGLAILLMVVDHLLFNLVIVNGVNFPPYDWAIYRFLQLFFEIVFVFISGSACAFSRNNLKRGAICFAFGIGITLVTVIITPDLLILYGILHLLGTSMMLYGLLGRLLRRIPAVWGLCGFAALSLLTWRVPYGYVGIPHLAELSLPNALYQTDFLFPLGLPSPSFEAVDYFPLLPWLFVFLAGSFAGGIVKSGRGPAFLYRSHSRFLASVGRNTLIIYLAHQPVLYLILFLVYR